MGAVWDNINSDLQSKGEPHSVTGKSVFQLGDVIPNSKNWEMAEVIAGLQMCSGVSLSSSAFVLLPSRPGQGYKPQLRVLAFLLLCTLWHLWKLLPLSHPPEVTLPLPGSTLTSLELPPHPPQQRDKVQGLLESCVGRQRPSPSVHAACKCSGDCLVGLVQDFTEFLYAIDHSRAETEHPKKRNNTAMTAVTATSPQDNNSLDSSPCSYVSYPNRWAHDHQHL